MYVHVHKPLKTSSAIQVWGMISFLLLIYEKRNWYHWKAWLFLFTMMCHLSWLCNHGMCSTPEYRAKSEVKCCKMHCFQHRSLHFFWRCNVFWIVPRWQCMSCMNVNGVMFFSLKDKMCLNDVQVVIDEEWNAIPQLRVTRLVNSMRRCQAVVATDLLRCNHFSIKEGERERKRQTILCVSSLFCH